MKRLLCLLAFTLLLVGCAGEKGIVDKDGYQLDTRRQAQAAYPRIKVLVIHYTADDFDSSLATLTDKNVSSHYLIPAVLPLYHGKPRIWQLVPERSGGMRGLASGVALRVLTIPQLALSWKTAAGKNRQG